MHYERSYKGTDRKAADEKALCDILDYLGTENLPLYGDLVGLAVCIEHEIPCEANDGQLRKQSIQGLNMTFGFAGISGYPFHAFCRRYCPNKYREWMTTGDDAMELDTEGFAVEESV
jgi:hypothetical protein